MGNTACDACFVEGLNECSHAVVLTERRATTAPQPRPLVDDHELRQAAGNAVVNLQVYSSSSSPYQASMIAVALFAMVDRLDKLARCQC